MRDRGRPPARRRVELVGFATSRLGKDVVIAGRLGQEVAGRALLDRVTLASRAGGGSASSPGSTVPEVGSSCVSLAGEVPLSAESARSGSPCGWRTLTHAQRARRWSRPTGHRGSGGGEIDDPVGAQGGPAPRQLARRLGFTRAAPADARCAISPVGSGAGCVTPPAMRGQADVLLLDRATSDLDIETLTSLEDVLDGWAGTCSSSHDRPARTGL